MLTDGSMRPALGALPCWVRWSAAAGLTLMLLLQFLGDQSATYAGHIMELVWDLENFNAGSVLLPGPEFFDTNLRVGGPFFFLLHQPARLVRDPILGLHLVYAGYQALALIVLLLAARRAGLREDICWICVLLLALAGDNRHTILENGVLAAHMATVVLGLLLLALSSRRLRWVVAAGLGLAAAMALHLTTIAILPAAALGLILRAGRRLLPLLTFLATVAAGFGLALLVEFWTPEVAAHGPAGDSFVPGVLEALKTILSKPKMMAAMAAPFLWWGLGPLGVLLAIREIVRHPRSRPHWALAVTWAAGLAVMACAAAGEVVISLGPIQTHGLPLLKLSMLASPPMALLSALALVELSDRLPSPLRRYAGPALVLVVVAVEIAASAVRLARAESTPAPPPEPFLRSRSTIDAASTRVAPLLEAGVGRGAFGRDRLVSFDPIERLTAHWPLIHDDPGGTRQAVLLPWDPALDALSIPGSVRAGASRIVPGCVPLPLDRCGDRTGGERWCGRWEQPGPRGLVLLLRSGTDITLNPAPGALLARANVRWTRSWSNEGDGGNNFEWVLLEPGPVTREQRIKVLPARPPPRNENRQPSPLGYLFDAPDPPTLRAWWIPLPPDSRQ